LTVHATTPTRAATKIYYAGYVKWTKKKRPRETKRKGEEEKRRKERRRERRRRRGKLNTLPECFS
jgi:hypothetical protein